MRRIPGPTDRVVVIGAGLAGLSATLHLLGAGREVTVIEANDGPGGRAGQSTLLSPPPPPCGGRGEGPPPTHRYSFDTGATVLTMPELVDEALHAVGESLADRLELIPLHPAYRAHFADGSTISVHTNEEAMAAEVRRVAGAREADGYRKLRAWLTSLYRVQRNRFIGANFDSPLNLLVPELAHLVALGGFGRLGPKIGRFLRDDRLRRLFSFQSLYAGVPPRHALAAYAVIAYMDTVAGVYFPRGGVASVADAMAKAATEAGAKLQYGQPVERLERQGSRVIAVHTAGERIPCDAVVLTPDLPVSYRLLGRTPRRPIRPRWSPSAFVLHAGVNRTWPHLGHHTIFFGDAWDQTFQEITGDRLMSDPSLLVTRPTATDPTLAPAGRHQLTVLAPCPNLHTGPIDWRRITPAYRAEIVRTLQARGLTGLGAAIEAERLVTPADWAAQGLAAGTPFSLAHTFRQTGPFRPRNLISGIDNAILAGCGTTPGVGIPPVLISGRLAAQRVI